YSAIVIVAGLMVFVNYHFDFIALAWKAFRLPSLILSDYLIPDSLEQLLGYQPSEALNWVQSTASSKYSLATLLALEQNYTWATRIIIALSLFFASYQVSRYKNMGAEKLSAENYLKKIVPTVPGEELLEHFDPSNIPLEYDFSLTPNQNAFRMPVSLVPFISCYPPIGISRKEINRPICKGGQWQDYRQDIATCVFSRQLGPKLPSKISLFPYHLKKVVAIMLARFSDPKEKNLVIKRLSKRHFYQRTFLMGLLKETQKKGVMPPKRFRFILHQKDRLMYLALYGVRSRLSWYEVVGIVSHFQYETALDKAIKKPQIQLALFELEHSVKAMQKHDCAEHNIYA
ncbi:MAG: hypothetical protein Q9M92_11330, partial [Enterobacterales bacterium]|nr:hypothetical protein [Enterobacterales bacterium]